MPAQIFSINLIFLLHTTRLRILNSFQLLRLLEQFHNEFHVLKELDTGGKWKKRKKTLGQIRRTSSGSIARFVYRINCIYYTRKDVYRYKCSGASPIVMLNNVAGPRCYKVTAVSCSLSDVGHPWIINSFVSLAVRRWTGSQRVELSPEGQRKGNEHRERTGRWQAGWARHLLFDVQLLSSWKPRDWFERLNVARRGSNWEWVD